MNFFMKTIKNSTLHRCYFRCIWLLIMASPLVSIAQNTTQKNKASGRFSILMANGNQTIGFPFQNWFTSFNPSFNLGIDYRLNKGEQHAVIAGLTTTFIINKVTGHVFAPGLHLKYRYTHKIGCFVSVGLEGGGLFQFYPRAGWKYNSNTQEYDAQTEIIAATYLGFQMTLGYDFAPQLNAPYAVFLRSKSLLQYPYFNASFPILPHQLIELGLRIKLSKKSK